MSVEIEPSIPSIHHLHRELTNSNHGKVGGSGSGGGGGHLAPQLAPAGGRSVSPAWSAQTNLLKQTHWSVANYIKLVFFQS